MKKASILLKVLRHVIWHVLFSYNFFFKQYHRTSQGRRRTKKAKWWYSTGKNRNKSVYGTAGLFSVEKVSAKQNREAVLNTNTQEIMDVLRRCEGGTVHSGISTANKDNFSKENPGQIFFVLFKRSKYSS